LSDSAQVPAKAMPALASSLLMVPSSASGRIKGKDGQVLLVYLNAKTYQ
jgi:hypothetical protein